MNILFYTFRFSSIKFWTFIDKNLELERCMYIISVFLFLVPKFECLSNSHLMMYDYIE